jgi:hypothetical protein
MQQAQDTLDQDVSKLNVKKQLDPRYVIFSKVIRSSYGAIRKIIECLQLFSSILFQLLITLTLRSIMYLDYNAVD